MLERKTQFSQFFRIVSFLPRGMGILTNWLFVIQQHILLSIPILPLTVFSDLHLVIY